MWIVRLALRRPYTFVVASMLVFILGIYMILAVIPTDIFPDVNIPVISIAFNYTGMSPHDMEGRIVTPFERILTTTVNDISRIDSQSLFGIGVIKVYFQPGASIENANAQITAISQTAVRILPPGAQPPLIIEYNASSVPVLQLALSSDTIPEAKLFDLAFQQVRPHLITIPGVQIPYPYGGKIRQVLVDLNPDQLYAYGISPQDVSTAINSQSVIIPAGTAKIGTQEYQVALNASPLKVDEMNNLPIKTVDDATVYIHDIAHVRDGFQVQTNVVHTNGKASVLMPIIKAGGASTLSVVNDILAALPGVMQSLPPEAKDLKITPMFDQSVFVRASVEGVIKEAAIAAGLTALMILLFLGSWRSTLIVIASIPLSILVSIIILGFLGYTLNVMTLGGMALAVGILVDDATVEIENIHRNLHQRKRLVQAILDGASQIAVPAFVSTLCICIVFVPVVFISGAAKFLFTPLAMAVVFAMMTSYLLSRTLVPTMVHYLLAGEVEMYGGVIDKDDPRAQHLQHIKEAHEHHHPVPQEDVTLGERISEVLTHPFARLLLIGLLLAITAFIAVLGYTPVGAKLAKIGGITGALFGFLAAYGAIIVTVLLYIGLFLCLAYFALLFHNTFNRIFEAFRRFYGGLLDLALDFRGLVIIAFVILAGGSCLLMAIIGRDFFPAVDTGQIRLHVRAPSGTRIEQTSEYFAQVENELRKIIPPKELAAMIDNMGIPNSSINLSLSDGSMMSPADGEILISLNDNHHPTAGYLTEIRDKIAPMFPKLTIYSAPADIVTQVLNFGLQAPIDVQITGIDAPGNYAYAQEILGKVQQIPGVVDIRMQQVPNTPNIQVNVDRTLASEVGMQQKDVAGDLLVSLSSSNQTAPNFFLNPANGVSYSIFVQTPQYKMDSINDLTNTPLIPTAMPVPAQDSQLLGNVATVERGTTPTNITHSNIQPSFDVLMGVQGTDLASGATQIQKIIDDTKKDMPKTSRIKVQGQVESMHDSFTGLGYGLIFAIVLVYLLMVINFQSWLDPLIILMALPGALAGILWMLWATQTNISVPALMGAIMSIGVATANSILMITFANDQRLEGMNARDAALAAGMTRLRPVLMTAAAMIIGMLPMSLGLGEGGEQNAPLGRAVIGGLSFATFATLFFVPTVYSVLRTKPPKTHVEKELE
jgi:multidrug efflux pump subunit AcrB